MGNRRRLAAAAAVCAIGAAWAPAGASGLGVPPTVGPEGCDDLTQTNADFEAYGPTDVNAQAGNGRLTANENGAGTLTVFKYPDPSLYNQVKYFALRRDANGKVEAQAPNEGSFAGVRYRKRDGSTGFAWLRDWRSSQRYDSEDTPVPVTRYRSPARLGLAVTGVDIVPPNGDRLVRDYWVSRSARSPVRSASLVYFGNFNATATHIPELPIADWCVSALSDQSAAYDAAHRAVVNSWAGTDLATARQTSSAVAFGFQRGDSAHQVGGDAYEPLALPGGAPDAYDQATDSPHRLTGNDQATGQTTAALEQRLRFREGRAEARVIVAAGRDPASALAALDRGRSASLAGEMAAERRDWRRFLARTLLPRRGGARVRAVAKRALISVRLARASRTGAIVASVNTQGPYGEDWIRDGAFINRLLDINGYSGYVTQHNRFYARVQTSTDNPGLRPPGNWAMNSYSDGVDGAPILWEIDETGLGTWTLFDHYRYMRGSAARRYLAQVYPAIARAADYMTLCKDPTNGLQCIANEDDNFTPSQSLHGAETVYLGLRSSIAAAAAAGDRSDRVGQWKDRLAELGKAIDELYDPARGAYASGGSGNAYNLDYGDGGWLLWPVRFKPYGDPTMTSEAKAVYSSMKASLGSARGQYEAKALLGLSYAWAPFSHAHRNRLDGTLRYMARSLTTPTGLLGESWTRLAGGKPIPVQDMPHVWEHTLFYLAALRIEGSRGYSFQGRDFFARACAAHRAPASACRG